MRAHAETVGDGLEVFFLLVDAVAAAPPPGLVDEWSVSGIHKADNAVIDADGHVGGEVGEFVFFAEFFNQRGILRSFFSRVEARARRAWIGNVDPDKTILLFTGIAASVDAIDF